MSPAHVPRELRERAGAQARFRCGYCLTSEAIVGMPLELDHIIPESRGGPTEEENLWLACSPCNAAKSDRVATPDPVSGELVRFFDPRHQIWAEHFRWNDEGDRIVGLTPTGQATIATLDLNRRLLVLARQSWVVVGWHPPKD